MERRPDPDFPNPSQRVQVSTEGGIQPIWRADGKELFFLASDGRLMAVPVQLSQKVVVGATEPQSSGRLGFFFLTACPDDETVVVEVGEQAM